MLYDLTTHKGNPGLSCASASGLAPATIRYLFSYNFDKPGADTCKKAVELQSKITTGKGSGVFVGVCLCVA